MWLTSLPRLYFVTPRVRAACSTDTVVARAPVTPILELGVGWNAELDAIDNVFLVGWEEGTRALVAVRQRADPPCRQMYLCARAGPGGTLIHGRIVGFAQLGCRRLARGSILHCVRVHEMDRLTPLAGERA